MRDLIKQPFCAEDFSGVTRYAELNEIATLAQAIFTEWLEGQEKVYGTVMPDGTTFEVWTKNRMRPDTLKGRLVGIEKIGEGET